MPCYNSANTIDDSIMSVLKQSYHKFELLVIDDGSNDDTIERVMSFKDSRIRIIKQKRNQGVALSRNAGLLKMQGKWVQFLDSDDYIYPEKFEKQLSVSADADIVLSDCEIVYPDGRRVQFESLHESGYLQIEDFIYTNPILIHAPLIRRSIIGQDHFFNPSFCHEDWAFWIHLASTKPYLAYLPDILSTYNRRLGSRSFDLIENYRNRIDCLTNIRNRAFCMDPDLQIHFDNSILNNKYRLTKMLFKSGRIEEGDKVFCSIEGVLDKKYNRVLQSERLRGVCVAFMKKILGWIRFYLPAKFFLLWL